MKISVIALGGVLTLGLLPGALSARPRNRNSSNSVVATSDQKSDETRRIEGEQRFHANCSRCHAAPHKFPPRMMGTIVRHMRVRATLTDEDTRLILFYMSQ